MQEVRNKGAALDATHSKGTSDFHTNLNLAGQEKALVTRCAALSGNCGHFSCLHLRIWMTLQSGSDGCYPLDQ